MKTTLSALALTAFAGTALAQGTTPPPWDRHIDRGDVQIVLDAATGTFVPQITPHTANTTTSSVDLGTNIHIGINGAPLGPFFRPKVMYGIVGAMCGPGGCGWTCTLGSCNKYGNGQMDCMCMEYMERVLPPGSPVSVSEGSVVTASLSAAPGSAPEVHPFGDSLSVPVIFSSGIPTTAVDNVELIETTPRSVTAFCSSLECTESGAIVSFRSTRGGSADVDASGLMATGGEIKIKHKGWDGLIYHRYTAVATFSDGTNTDVTESCDFAQSGIGVQVVCVLADGTEVPALSTTTSSASWTTRCPIDPVSPPQWRMGAGKASFSDLSLMMTTRRTHAPATVFVPDSTGGVMSIPNVVEVQCRPICIVAPCPGDWTNLGSMEITSNQPSLHVSNVALKGKVEPCAGCPNSPIDTSEVYGTGTATLAEVPTDMDGDGDLDTAYRVIHCCIGSSGQDGVEIKWPPATLSAREKVYNGHVTLMKAFDDTTGAECRMTVTKDPLTDDMGLMPDYTLMGSTQTLVTAYDDNDNPIGSFILGIAGVATIDYSALCPPGSYPTFVTIGNKKFFTGCRWIFDLVAPGGTTITNVHTVSFEALGATVPFNTVTRTGHYTNDGEDIILGDLQATTAPTGPTCDSTDFNNDGLFPDTMDIDDFLSVFSGGVCSDGTLCNSDTDFNNDGLFPDTMDIDSLLSVFSGGPCI